MRILGMLSALLLPAVSVLAAAQPEAVTKVASKNVEYVWQGLSREGSLVTATLLATSKEGMQLAPKGNMVMIDEAGNKYSSGLGANSKLALREGVPVRLTWTFGKKAFGGIDPANVPSAKLLRFAAVIVHVGVGSKRDTIEFRNVPATTPKAK